MAILSSKKNTPKKAKAVKTEVAVVKAPSTAVPHINLSSVLLHPRITEKASQEALKNVYLFEVSHTATKGTIASAIKEMYKVTPVKVNVVFAHAKTVFIRGKKGVKSRVKKAYVFLKKGDKIEFV